MLWNGKIIGGLWYVDQDDADHRLEKGKLWRKLTVRLAGTLAPQQDAALVHLRGWWEKWHPKEEYDAESAEAAFEREVLSAYKLGAIDWKLKGLDSWNGGLKDGAILVPEKKRGDKRGGTPGTNLLALVLKDLAKPDGSKSATDANLLALAKFLDGIGMACWAFLPEDMDKWGGLPKDKEAWAAYGNSGSEELLDRLESRDDMTKWVENRKQSVLKQFCKKIAEKNGLKLVLKWCERQADALNADKPCENLLLELKAEANRRFWRQVLRVGMAVLGVFALLGAGIWGWGLYQQEVQSFELYQQRLEEAGNGALEKLTALETDLEAGSGGVFLRKQWKSLRFEVMNRLDEELEDLTKKIEKLQKRGQYLDAAEICARIGACLRQRVGDSSEWEEKERRYRTQDRELDDQMAQVETLLNARDYASARRKLNELDQMAMDELRKQRKKEMRERLNCEPLFWERWEKIQEQAAPNKNLADWRRALRELNEMEPDMASHPAVVLPTTEAMVNQRNALEKRLGTWSNVNTLCGATFKKWTAASPAGRQQLRVEVIRDLERCLEDLDGIYNENGGQPCGGAEMEKLYKDINQALSRLQRD